MNHLTTTGFEDMEDDTPMSFTSAPAAANTFTSLCGRCGGTGRWQGPGDCVGNRLCLACKGAGTQVYKTSPEARAKARSAASRKRDREAQAKLDKAVQWHADHPEASAWLRGAAERGSNFAQSLLGSVQTYGALTPRQLEVVLGCAKQDAERQAARDAAKAAREAAAPTVDAQALEAAFAKAKASGLKWPKINLGGIKVSPAGENSANAGALYVKEGDTYLGKVLGGRFLKSRDCAPEQEQTVVGLIADPKGYAEAYGLRTGVCCICSKQLTNEDSVNRGIGPICARKFGW
jgi:hypothetical protein